MLLRDRVVLITGAKRIGQVVAAEAAARGAHVAISYRTSRAEADAGAAKVAEHGRRAHLVQADLTRAADCEAAVASTVEALGRLDVLVNMASSYVHTPIAELTAERWDAALAVDLRATFLCALAAVPHMRAAGGGRIVNFSDWTARSGRPRYVGYLPYYVAKAGVIALTEALALELAPLGILVNAIAPGPIVAPPELGDEEREAVERATPLGRWGGEGEIARAVIDLIESDFITGETIRVDGGRHVK
jgi:NAD(P)-dependent dehydrogenase (short-subunit alcohol dehydrogenase family)